MIVNGSVAEEWALNNRKYYENVTHPIYVADMNLGSLSFLDMLSKYSNIELVTRTGPLIAESLKMNGTRIIQVATANDSRTWKASVFIDASYEGDLVRYSGASYTWGRESRDQYGESYAGVRPYDTFANFLPDHPVNATLNNGSLAPYVSPEKLGPVGSGDLNIMAFTYRLCITTTKAKQASFLRPPNYDPNNFILLQRYIDSLEASGKYPSGVPITALLDLNPYSDCGCPTKDIFDMNGSINRPFTTDPVNLSDGYANGTDEDRRRITQNISDYVLGFLWYILTSPDVPAYTRNSLEQYGLCNDQWPENHHMPPQLYVREGLRLVNENVFTQNDVLSGLCRNDTIALGSWWKLDIHAVTRTANGTRAMNEGQIYTDIAKINGSKSGPTFEIPASVLLPKRAEVTNLIVPVCHAASHIAYSATRLEPTFMLLGGAAGYFAAYSILHDRIDVQAVNVHEVQQALTRDGVPLHYPPGHCD
jgi:hypothetical protein